jgi:two-component system sensor histidine kinase UhpB
MALHTRLGARLAAWLTGLSVFEKVIVANSAIISLDTLLGWWITQRGPETYHYLIDTAFITLAVLIGLAVNFALLRAAFAPLRAVMTTIHAVEDGDLDARAAASPFDADAAALARAFNGMLDTLTHLRDESAGHVLQAQEQERRRLALELHDQTGQSLTALALHLSAVAARLEGETSEAAVQARAQLQRLDVLAESMLRDVQTLAQQLRPPLLDDLGLVAALRWLADDASERLDTRVSVRLAGLAASPAPHSRLLPPGSDSSADVGAPQTPMAETLDGGTRLPAEIETALFRIAQEGLTNAVRHGHASRVALLLRKTTSQATLLLADNGSGFRLPRAGRAIGAGRRGTGLDGMGERARSLGGHLTIRTQPGHGCALRASVPLAHICDEVHSGAVRQPTAPLPVPR